MTVNTVNTVNRLGHTFELDDYFEVTNYEVTILTSKLETHNRLCSCLEEQIAGIIE